MKHNDYCHSVLGIPPLGSPVTWLVVIAIYRRATHLYVGKRWLVNRRDSLRRDDNNLSPEIV